MKLTYGQAFRQALYDELMQDPSVVLFGEDLRYNLYGYTDGLFDTFGPERVIDIPLSEASVMGTVCGAAICGLRPVIDLTIPNFLYVAMDQIANIAAKSHYMYNGAYTLPLTVFTFSMEGSGNAAQHSDRLHSLFMGIPGLEVICPASPQDMYTMSRAAIENDNPVLCFADRSLFWQSEEVSTENTGPSGGAHVVAEGKDLTVITISSCLQMAKDILPILRSENISAEIIDVRSLNPLDFKTIRISVKKTGRVVICDPSSRSCSAASEIAAMLAEFSFADLVAPIQIVAAENTPLPFANNLETEILVTKEKILDRILQFLGKREGQDYVDKKGTYSHM